MLWEETKRGSNFVSCRGQERPAYSPRAPRLGEERVVCHSGRPPRAGLDGGPAAHGHTPSPRQRGAPERSGAEVAPCFPELVTWFLPPQGTRDDHMMWATNARPPAWLPRSGQLVTSIGETGRRNGASLTLCGRTGVVHYLSVCVRCLECVPDEPRGSAAPARDAPASRGGGDRAHGEGRAVASSLSWEELWAATASFWSVPGDSGRQSNRHHPGLGPSSAGTVQRRAGARRAHAAVAGAADMPGAESALEVSGEASVATGRDRDKPCIRHPQTASPASRHPEIPVHSPGEGSGGRRPNLSFSG